MAIDGTGALLIADDSGDTVWRVAAANGAVTPEPIGSDRVVAAAGETAGDAGGDGAAASDAAQQIGGEAAGTSPTSPPSAGAGMESPSEAQATTADAPSEPSQPSASTEQASTAPSGGAAAPTPPQTAIAPAVLPEGTVQEGAEQQSD